MILDPARGALDEDRLAKTISSLLLRMYSLNLLGIHTALVGFTNLFIGSLEPSKRRGTEVR
jgi:hypothetical protein